MALAARSDATIDPAPSSFSFGGSTSMARSSSSSPSLVCEAESDLGGSTRALAGRPRKGANSPSLDSSTPWMTRFSLSR